MVRRRPSPQAAHDVIDLCGWTESLTAPLRRREVARPQVTLILSWGPPLRLLDPARPDAPGAALGSFVAGFDDGLSVVAHDGWSEGLEIRLTPLGAARVFGLPMSEIARQVVPVGALLGPEGTRLAERVAEAPSWAERFALVDALVARRLADAPASPPDTAWAWRRLRASGGTEPVGSLAAALGCSRRHLARRFSDGIGLPPKAAARVLRFDRARALLERDDGAGLAEIAARCGYADQPHLNRDFRDFAGGPPTDFLARRLPGGAGISAA